MKLNDQILSLIKGNKVEDLETYLVEDSKELSSFMDKEYEQEDLLRAAFKSKNPDIIDAFLSYPKINWSLALSVIYSLSYTHKRFDASIENKESIISKKIFKKVKKNVFLKAVNFADEKFLISICDTYDKIRLSTSFKNECYDIRSTNFYSPNIWGLALTFLEVKTTPVQLKPLVKKILGGGASIFNFPGTNQSTLLDIAKQNGYLNVLKDNVKKEFFQCIASDNSERCRIILDYYPELLNEKSEEALFNTPLMHAVSYGSTTVIKKLLSTQDINVLAENKASLVAEQIGKKSDSVNDSNYKQGIKLIQEHRTSSNLWKKAIETQDANTVEKFLILDPSLATKPIGGENDLRPLEVLLEKEKIDQNDFDFEKITFLLLKNGANLEEKALAKYSNQIVDSINDFCVFNNGRLPGEKSAENQVDLNQTDPEQIGAKEFRALIEDIYVLASKNSNQDLMTGISVHYTDFSNEKLLISAIKKDDLSLVQYLLGEDNCNLWSTNANGELACEIKIKTKNSEQITRCLRQKMVHNFKKAIETSNNDIINKALALQPSLLTQTLDDGYFILNDADLHIGICRNTNLREKFIPYLYKEFCKGFDKEKAYIFKNFYPEFQMLSENFSKLEIKESLKSGSLSIFSSGKNGQGPFDAKKINVYPNIVHTESSSDRISLLVQYISLLYKHELFSTEVSLDHEIKLSPLDEDMAEDWVVTESPIEKLILEQFKKLSRHRSWESIGGNILVTCSPEGINFISKKSTTYDEMVNRAQQQLNKNINRNPQTTCYYELIVSLATSLKTIRNINTDVFSKVVERVANEFAQKFSLDRTSGNNLKTTLGTS